MSEPRAAPVSALEWGVAGATLPGQRASGDAHVILPVPHGVLVGVVDGLGHGPEAATAARCAVNTIRAHPRDPVTELMRHCHQALTGTRGAVASIARFDLLENTLSWISVGNIQGALVRADPATHPRIERVLSRRGVVGLQLPMLQASVTTIAPGDLVALATDGVAPGFADHVVPGHPQAVADRIMDACRKGDDDALVVVGRYQGGHAP